jgi:biopolymer transport protein ExbD
MRIPYEPPDESFPINVTNMVDVFLLLLIFFLVATTFAQEERDTRVKLPVAGPPTAITAATRDLVLNVREDGSVTVGGKSVNASDLDAVLTRAAHDDTTRKVLIRTDAKAQMEHFARVTLACRRAGFDEARIGYVPESAK